MKTLTRNLTLFLLMTVCLSLASGCETVDPKQPIHWRDFMHSASETILLDIASSQLWIAGFVLTFTLFVFVIAARSRRLSDGRS